uniref:Uncharacterized protein n=1 Tax=Dunaliella tertiolecta TaxID=3047 RepID=A0A7S3VLX3_DUNTE
MYSLKIEAQKRAVLVTQAPEDELDDGTAALRDALEADLAEGAVEFSIGNPRVEHITGVVHLYRDFPVPAPQQVARAAGAAGGAGGAWGNAPSELSRPPVFSLPVGCYAPRKFSCSATPPCLLFHDEFLHLILFPSA